MDFIKLQGIIDAIETESKLPSPSHANLARLIKMALTEIISSLQYVIEETPRKIKKLKN